MSAIVAEIYRYPIKGLTPERLAATTLTVGEGLPEDRRFALHVGNAPFDPVAPSWMAKTNFLMLMRDERLAKLRSRFEPATSTLIIERDGKQVLRADLASSSGRTIVEQFFAAFMATSVRRTPRLVEASGHMFSDVAAKVVSIIGLASIKDLERVVRAPVDPLRFRANLYVDGQPPWSEFDWVGREIRLGDARLRGMKRIQRCAATNVDPVSGARDLNIPRTLADAFGHPDCGIYAEVIAGAPIRIGDAIAPA